MPACWRPSRATRTRTMRDFFLLCLLTGARRGNVQAMRWADVDLSGGCWTVPGSEHKTKRPITIPLSTPVLAILQARQAFHGGKGYVFPSSSASGHLEEPKAAWKRVLTRAGLEGLRIHDLRHTAAFVAGESGRTADPDRGGAGAHPDQHDQPLCPSGGRSGPAGPGAQRQRHHGDPQPTRRGHPFTADFEECVMSDLHRRLERER
jgi:hypothetical protein